MIDAQRRGRAEDRARRRLALPRLELSDEAIERVVELAAFGAARLEGALAELPESQAEAVRARVLCEQSYTEIAAAQSARKSSVLILALAFVAAVLARGEGGSSPPADERLASRGRTPSGGSLCGRCAPPRTDGDADRGHRDAALQRARRRAGDPLDEDRYRDLKQDPMLRRKGIQWDQLRTAVTGQNVSVYATRGADGEACVIASSARYGTTFGCGDPTGHTRAITLRFGRDRDTSIVVGLVPDGAREVELWTGAQTIAARVERNAFVGLVGHEETSVRWRDAAGSHQEQLAPGPRAGSAPDPYSGRRETQMLSATAPDPTGGDGRDGFIPARAATSATVSPRSKRA